jgi:hypothetical protein
MSDKQLTAAWGIVIAVGIIVGIIASVWVFEDRIEKRILSQLRDPEVLREIASLIRPCLTLDHDGLIRTYSGAGQFIEKISVEISKDEPNEIIMCPTEHLSTQAILECLNYNFYITARRTGKSDWLFALSSPVYLVSEGSPEKKE